MEFLDFVEFLSSIYFYAYIKEEKHNSFSLFMENYDFKKIIAKLRASTGEITTVQKIDSVTNEVYILQNKTGEKFVLKIINADKRDGNDIDHVVMDGQHSNYFRKLISTFLYDKRRVLLLEHLDGKSLAELIQEGTTLPDNLFQQFCNFFKEISLLKAHNYGAVNNNFNAQFVSWNDFLSSKLLKYSNNIKDEMLFSLEEKSRLEQSISRINLDEAVLVPADVNLSNFLITDSNSLKVLDVGVYISGDALLPYGLLMAHSWGTDLAAAILEFFPESEHQLHLYACLEMLAILSFTMENNPDSIYTLKPFGQNMAAVKILKDNLKFL